jgi:hypothetical protein
MACKTIKTKCGNAIEVDDGIGWPFCLRVEGDDGKCVTLNLSPDDARALARTLDAFATIHER